MTAQRDTSATGRGSIAHQVANGLGWAIVVAGAILALLIAGPLALGDHPHTDLSGSMEPTIAPGDVVINEQIAPWEAKVGDIVTFRDPQDESRLLTHRVVSTRDTGSHIWFVTQGDANTAKEHWRVSATGAIGRLVYTVPWVGHLAILTRSKLGWALLVGVPLLLILIEELVRIWRPQPRAREGGEMHGAG